ncbi:signal transduction histidine kinase [Microterricola gilva]|uniref:histidine kinase n=1 Tax=Microterricola gilva TaxID=393267 RepID=A0A4Q8AK37_9MICO|nr:sensor histidine kinase [Microterricola gilva]RZU64860.1 signal transduction histidine kinase [Microterricola gilva]
MTHPTFSPDYPASVVGGELRLPKPPGVFRRFWARHPVLTDSLIAAVYAVPTFVGTVGMIVGWGESILPLWVSVLHLFAVAFIAGAVVFWRRRHPWLLMTTAWLLALVVYPLGTTDVLPILVALYSLAVYRSVRAAWIAFGVSLLVGTASAYIAVAALDSGALSPFGDDAPASASQTAVLMLIATLIGVTMGNRRRYLVALIDRARDLARERDQQAELATARERARIAREMHDIVAHSLTVMVTLADGSAATTARDPERAADAMRRVAETGRDALGDMRRMLGLLSEPGEAGTAAGELAPQPDLRALPALIDDFRALGMPVTLRTSGVPVTDGIIELTVYRIVQEALTNALRYAATAHTVTVDIRHAGEDVTVTVRDDAPTPSTTAAPGTGRGLIGMRERIALYGGTLDVGPRAGFGWQVHAQLRATSTSTTPTPTMTKVME